MIVCPACNICNCRASVVLLFAFFDTCLSLCSLLSCVPCRLRLVPALTQIDMASGRQVRPRIQQARMRSARPGLRLDPSTTLAAPSTSTACRSTPSSCRPPTCIVMTSHVHARGAPCTTQVARSLPCPKVPSLLHQPGSRGLSTLLAPLIPMAIVCVKSLAGPHAQVVDVMSEATRVFRSQITHPVITRPTSYTTTPSSLLAWTLSCA